VGRPIIKDEMFKNIITGEEGECYPLQGFPVTVDCSTLEPVFHPLYLKMQEVLRLRNSPIVKRSVKSCDDAFALYLYEHCFKVDPEFYRTMVFFAINLREHVNEAGEVKCQRYKLQVSKHENFVFCASNTAEVVPLLADSFLGVFLPDRYERFNQLQAKNLMLHFSKWLFLHDLSCFTLKQKHSEDA